MFCFFSFSFGSLFWMVLCVCHSGVLRLYLCESVSLCVCGGGCYGNSSRYCFSSAETWRDTIEAGDVIPQLRTSHVEAHEVSDREEGVKTQGS